MARHKRKNNRSLIIILTALIIHITCCNILNINNYLKYNKLEEKSIKLNNDYKSLNKEYERLNKEKNLLNEKTNSYKNIDENINNLKKEVYSLSSKLEQTIVDKKTDKKIAYLTFDDGPYYNTYNVLDILKKNKVKATFFTIGYNKDICYDRKTESCKDMYKKIVDEGHTIANHTYTHAIFKGLYDSTSSFISDVKTQENLIKERTGVTTNIIRFPGGSATAKNLKQSIISELKNNGYGWVDWSASDGDGGNLTSQEVAWTNLKNTINEDIEVILFHDYNLITTSILDDVIKYLQDNNYIILPLFYESIKVNK